MPETATRRVSSLEMPLENRGSLDQTTVIDRSRPTAAANFAVAPQSILLISPVRNEEAYIEQTARAVALQTIRPSKWIVVDDGSSDHTAEILKRLAKEIDFMTVITVDERQQIDQIKDRLAIAAEARAFNIGLHSVVWRSFDYIAKLDGDTELPPRYFELLLNEFERDPRLGVAGGVYADPDPQRTCEWKLVRIPDHHVPGTLKCYSRACLQTVGGMQERLGWDTIDETYARMRGFRTRSFPHLVVLHHRAVGSADGTLRGRAREGQTAYILHYTPTWVILRSLFKTSRMRPQGLSGLAFLYGYVRSAVRRVPRVEDPTFRRFIRRHLLTRMLQACRSPHR